MVDKNNNILNIGDSMQNKAGVTGTLTNINGVTRIVVKNQSGKTIQTMKPSEVVLSNFEKVVV